MQLLQVISEYGHTVQLQNCHLCWRRLLVAPQDVIFSLRASPLTVAAISKNSSPLPSRPIHFFPLPSVRSRPHLLYVYSLWRLLVITNVSNNAVIRIWSSTAKLSGIHMFRYGVYSPEEWLWIDSNNKNGNETFHRDLSWPWVAGDLLSLWSSGGLKLPEL